MEAEPEKFETDKELSVVTLVEDQKPKRRDRSWLPAMLVGTGLGIAIALGGIRLTSRPIPTPKPSQTQASSMTVSVALVENTRIARILNVTGTVAARELIAVLPQITGLQIEQILVDEGDLVKAGQVMAVLDNSVLQTQINGAKAEIESNQAVVRQRQAALAQAQASLAEAERTLERNQQLANAGAISQQEFDARATEAATARENVQVAAANINSAQANVRSSTARLQQLQTQLGQTSVRAPAAGIVAEKNIAIGNVAGNQQLFSIIQGGELELQAQVPAIQLPQVQIGATAKISSDGDSRVSLEGRVREIAPLVNAQSRQAIVKIDLPNTTLLRPGVFARAAITTNTVPGITIPAKAVVPQPDGTSTVFVLIDEDKVEARSVEVGQILNSGKVEIKNALKAGERVVLKGGGYLKDGDRVIVAGAGRDGDRLHIDKNDLPRISLLSAGQFQFLRTTEKGIVPGLAVPARAVVSQSDGSSKVFVLTNQEKVQSQPVELGKNLPDGRVEIKKGLSEDALVIVDGVRNLKDGDRVLVVGNSKR